MGTFSSADELGVGCHARGTGITIVEQAGEGNDLVNACVTYTLGDYLERLTLTGSSAINGTGNALANVLTGNSGSNTLSGGEGNDILDPGSAGTDVLAGDNGDDTYIVTQVGATDQITFTGYYTATANRRVDAVQVITEGTSDYNAGSSDVTRNKKIERFDFDGLVAAFDTARAANPSLTTWALTNALLAQYLAGSDTAAFGGDLAYQYGRFGTLSGISFNPATGILGASTFGTAAQALQTAGSLQDTTPRLS